MGPQLWTLALLVAAGAAPTDHWATNQRNLSVPIKLLEHRADIRQMILFISKDQGKTWSEAAVAPPDKENFGFYADTDGMYWMKLCTVFRDGTRTPSDINKGQPALKILVDTLKPQVRIVSAERQGDGIAVRWEIQEDHPELGSLKLEYSSADDPTHQWYTVPVDPTLTGSGRFRFVGTGAVTVRMQLRDTAGNMGLDKNEVGGTTLAQASGAAPLLPGTNPPAPVPMLPLPPSFSVPPSPAPTPPTPVWENASAQPVLPRESQLPLMPAAAPSHAVQPIPITSNTSSGPRVIGSSDNAGIMQASVPSEPVRRPRGPLPARQFVNEPRITLQYNVKNKGPSGIGLVEVWHTTDEGQVWKKLVSVPQTGASNERDSAESAFLPVELPSEGVYGLRLVVLSRAGRGKPAPHSGDAPEIVVEVDQTPPRVVLQQPQPDPHHANTLMLLWTVTDANLPASPITLQWGESRTATRWNTIAANQPNTGKFPWKVAPDVPTHVYLRLVAQDSAGNVSEAISEEPVLVDLSEPEARLIGVIAAPVGQAQP